ncbi:MAG: ProQ/FINO family protein [Thiolinea sp.]
MTDTPNKTLTLKRKRIVKRSDLPAGKLGSPGRKSPAPGKPKPKAKAKKPAQPPRKPTTPPSELRARELDRRLHDFEVWRTFKPLAIGIEKDIFRLMNDEQFTGGSKRMLQKLLRRHTRHPKYLQALVQGGGERFRLSGVVDGQVTAEQIVLAQQGIDQKAKRDCPRGKSQSG